MKKYIALLILNCCVNICIAQTYEQGDLVKIDLVDGSKLIGVIQSIQDEEIILLGSTNNSYKLKHTDILSIRMRASINGKASSFKKLFLSPSGFTIDQGEWQYENAAFLGFGVGYGLSDRFALHVYSELYSPIANGSRPFTVLSPRYSIPTAFGSILLNPNVILFPRTDDILSFIMMNVVFSFGDQNEYFNLSLAYGRTDNNFNRDQNSAPISGAYYRRMNEKYSLIFETWYSQYNDFNDSVMFYMPGVRYFGHNPNTAFSFHAVIAHDLEFGDVYPLPMISYLQRFGR